MPVVRDLCLRGLSAARCNHQENLRPLLVYPPGKLDPVKFPRHLNIGEEDTYVGLFRHRLERRVCAGDVYYFVSRSRE